MTGKPRRQERIRTLIEKGGIASQDQLARALHAQGVRVTQATLSRDLRELGVLKGPEGYSLPGAAAPQPAPGLDAALRTLLVAARPAGNLAVLHTGPGRAPLLALELDRAGLKDIQGTIAGDDTIFVATRSAGHAAKLAGRLGRLAGLGANNHR